MFIAGVDKFFAGVVGTAEEFIAGVVDTGDKHSFANISANFWKIQNGPNGILGGLGDTDSWKNLKSKISCQIPFNSLPREKVILSSASFVLFTIYLLCFAQLI